MRFLIPSYRLATLPQHFNGGPWYTLPIPGRFHFCRIDSVVMGTTFRGEQGPMEHCRCGAVRFYTDVFWTERNSRRRSLARARYTAL